MQDRVINTLAYLNRILLIQGSVLCGVCHRKPETLMHVFFEYPHFQAAHFQAALGNEVGQNAL